jgi:hypothetical protein
LRIQLGRDEEEEDELAMAKIDIFHEDEGGFNCRGSSLLPELGR